jgi:two-component system sensor histidine kinase PilS (NtrC family)
MVVPSARERNIRSIYLLMIFRLILATLILGTVIVLYAGRTTSFSLSPIYGLLVLTYIVSAFYWLALKWEIAPTVLLYIQLSVDVALATGILHYSGGSESILTLLYLLVIISSSIFLNLGGVLYVCSLASVAYGFLSWLQYRGLVSMVSFFEPDRVSRLPEQSVINVYLNICFFYLVAFLSGFVSEKLRRKGEELETTSQRLRKVQLDTDDILENIPSGLITLNGEGIVQNFNGAAETILDLDGNQVKGKPYDQVFGDTNEELKAILCSALEKAIVYERKELRAVTTKGRSMPLGISTTLLGVGEGERSGVIAVFQDLTEAKEKDAKLRRKDRLAVLGQLSAAIAHEIRNPLATISGSSEMLRSSTTIRGEEKKLMELITRESDRLNRIITDFLLYARISPADKAVVDIGKLVDETLMLVRNHNDFHSKIEINNTIHGQIAYALADQDQVKQIFLNITINALQAMPDGGCLTVGLAQVESESQRPGSDGMIRVFFQDTGVGVPAEELKNIFEPFYSSKKVGTGLGLSIAQRIVENNEGRLEVKSQVNKGTTFTVSLLAVSKDGEDKDETAKR